MQAFETVKQNLIERGYQVRVFATGREAALYLDSIVDGMSVGIGGSSTIKDIGVFELLASHNTVFWHWIQEPAEARKNAMQTTVYLTSVNALAESGEMINIDGVGNRISSTLFGHQKVYYVIGKNKLMPSYEDAVWRARNVAAPHRAQQLGAKTPCAERADRCYDCSCSGRICRAMVTLWGPMSGMDAEVLLVDEDIGL